MITTHNLEMTPPIQGRERTFAWFPPAYGQYDKVPYKTMATLDDFKYFSQATDTQVTENPVAKLEVDADSSVLNSKLNSIRQQLAKRRIDPNVIRQQCLIKPNSIQDYMKIPATWKPKYPEPNVEMLSEMYVSEKIDGDKEITIIDCDADQNLSVEITSHKEESGTIKRPLIRRPYTAPGHINKTDHASRCSSASVGTRLHSSGSIPRNQRSSSLLRQKLEHTSCSESNISNLRYERDLHKYKWLMEIPGDPFEIKRPHIPEKQQYFYEIAEIKVLPREPTMKKQNRDTFFYNSMPNQSLSFDISPSFMSEKYNRMKDRLRSQGKWNYSSKNFSFVY